MDYKTFVKQFNAQKKTKTEMDYVKKHITTEYLPFTKKLDEATAIAESALSVVNEDGTQRYRRNTPLLFSFFAIRLLRLYTDIEFEDAETAVMYDEFDKNGIFDVLFTALPEREYKQMQMYVQQRVEDVWENHMGLTSYLDTKLKAFEMLLNTAVDTLANFQIDKKTGDVIEFPGNTEG